MKREIREKLNMIKDLYPEERLKKSKERIMNLWEGKEQSDRMPFIVYPVNHNPYWGTFEPSERLNFILDDYIVRGEIDDDTIPTLFTGCRTSTIPNMFGAKEIILGEDITAEKKFQHLENLVLPEPQITEVPQYWLDMMQYFLEETEGELPIHVTDMQGPLDVAGVLFHYDEFMLLAFEDEARFKSLLNSITKAFILFFREQEKLLGELCVPTHLMSWDYVPPHYCASMSIDSLVMLSPSYYENYIKDTIEAVVKEFHRLIVHSCGDWRHMVKAVCETEGVIGVNASQMDLNMLKEGGLTRNVTAIIMSSYDDAVRQIQLAKDLGMKLDISVYEIMSFLVKPSGRFLLNDVKPKSGWTMQEKTLLKDREKILKDALSVR